MNHTCLVAGLFAFSMIVMLLIVAAWESNLEANDD